MEPDMLVQLQQELETLKETDPDKYDQFMARLKALLSQVTTDIQSATK